MPLLQALRACLLHESVTVQNLHYHVKRAQLKAGMCLSGSSSKEGMVIDTCHATSTASSTDGQTSPLTETSSLSLSDSTSKRTRKTSKQVSEARIRAKREREDYSRRFKKAFKEATRVVQGRKVGGPSNETVQQVINRLNAEYNLNGKRKLFIEYIEKVVLPLYPNISKTTKFDHVSGRLLCGPVILKVDSGPGRIVASEESISKRADFLEMGLFILMGLPNATSVQQEMDALYGAFKSATYARGEIILMEKMRDQADHQSRMLDEEADDDDEATDEQVDGANHTGRAEGALSLGFNDLATVVNGRENEDVSLKPFEKCFTRESILGSWRKVGFVPFTRMCLANKKVRHELGQQQANVALEELKEKYDALLARSKDNGLNAGVFSATIPVASRAKRVSDDAEQVKKLLEMKGAFSASSIWNICGSRIGNSRITLRAQKEQLAIDAAKAAAQLQNRTDRQQKILAYAQRALVKYRACCDSLTDKDWVDIIRWVLLESKSDGLMKDLKKKAAIVAKLATLEREWTTYIPLPEAT